jgi:hypothetical protein
VIVSWNTSDLLRNCLRSLEQIPTARAGQVIVVDNASSDGTVAMVRDEFPWVQLVANQENVGFGAANNIAFPLARGRYVLLLNPDTEATNGAIDSLVEYLDRHPEVGIAGTTLFNADGSLQPSCHPYYTFMNSLQHNRLVDRFTDRWKVEDAQKSARPSDVDWMIGACLAVRCEVLDVLHGFDPDFFLYAEEIDLQYRAHRMGWRVVYVPSSGVVHHGGQSARQAPVAAAFHDYRGRWLFIKKHYSPFSASAYLSKTVAALGVWLLYWRARSLLGAGPVADQQFRAYWRLLLWHVGGRDLPSAPAPTPRAGELTPFAS